MIDSTIVRAHACAAGYKRDSGASQALGRSKGGLTTKIHRVCEAWGGALTVTLTPGQHNDMTQASELIAPIKGAAIIADKAYDSQKLIAQIVAQGCVAVIPPRKNRKTPREYDKHVYKERHLIETLCAKLKHFRRVFARFDKTKDAYAAFIAIASTIIWLR